MSQIVSILKPAGEEGLTIPEMAEKLNVPESDIDALIRPFSKKPGQKSKKPAKSTKRGPQPGGKPGATKARILALLETAGSKGLTIKEVAEKLNLSRAGVSVWFGKTGKNLTTRLAPGCYALKS
jgi:plasmid maintenance system antidote protein VapI